MTIARKQLISSEVTSYYHVIARCVRRAYLCGSDRLTGKSYNHRKDWVLERLSLLVECFSIGVCAYAIMDNHYHLVLHLDQNLADQWTDSEVMSRKHRLFAQAQYKRLYSRHVSRTSSSEEVASDASVWRERLSSISWFMRCLNEDIAKKANKEDDCTGRFWQGRFKSQAILDLESLKTCMAYVDLNPARAGLSFTLISSDYASVQSRLLGSQSTKKHKGCEVPLVPFYNSNNNERHCIPFTLEDYIGYVESVGSVPRSNTASGSCFLKKLTSEPRPPINRMYGLEKAYGWAIGTRENLKSLAKTMNRSWIKGVGGGGVILSSA